MLGADAEVVARLTLDEAGATKGAAAAAAATRTVGTAATASTAKVGILKRGLQALSANVVIAGLAAIYGAFRLIGQSVRDAGVQEIAEGKLAQALRNTGDASAESADGLKRLAAETQAVSNYGDEAIITAQAMLLSFAETGGARGAGILTKSLVDMAAGLEKAGGGAQDLNQIAASLGKALTGGSGVLKRYGISLSETQQAAFDAAEGLDKVNLLAEVIESNFGGMAEATIDPVRQLQNAMGDLSEQAGGPFRAAMNEASVRLAALAQREDVVAMVRKIGQALGWLVTTSLKVFDAVSAGFQSFVIFTRRGVGAFTGALADALDRLASFAATTSAVLSNLGPIGRAFGSALSGVTGKIQAAAGAVGSYADTHQQLTGAMAESLERQRQAKAAADLAATAARGMARASGEMATQATSGAGAVRDLASSMDQVEGGAKKVTTSVDQIRQSVAALERRIREMEGVDIAELVRLEDQKQTLEAQLDQIEETVRLGVLRMRGEFDNLDASAVANRNTLAMPPIDDDAFQASLERAMAGVRKWQEDFAAQKEQARQQSEEFGAIIESGIENGIASLASALGEYAAGAASFGDVGAAVLGSIGSLAQQLGTYLIAFGVGIEGLKRSLQSLNPVFAVAAGAALVAIGAGIRGLAGRIGGGGASQSSPSRPAAPPSPSRGASDVAAGLALGFRPGGERAGADRQPASVTVNNQPPPVHVQIYGESTKEGIRRVKVTQDKLPGGYSL